MTTQQELNDSFDSMAQKALEVKAERDILLQERQVLRDELHRIELYNESLRKVAACAVEAVAEVEEWLGSASTRQAAEESWWRLRKALQRAGYEMKNGCLEYRGSVLRAMEHAGVGMDDEGVIRLRKFEDKPWMHASGEPLYEVLYRMKMRGKA